MESIQVHESRFYYKQSDDNASVYSLFALRHGTTSIVYPSMAIERNIDTHVLRLFGTLYTAMCNCASVAFIICLRDRQVVYKPNQNGLLGISSIIYDEDVPSSTQEEIAALHSSDLAVSVNTILFDYIRTQNGHFNIGLCLLPSGGICIPAKLSDDVIANWLQYWKRYVDKAVQCCVLVLRNREGNAAQFSTIFTSKTGEQTLVF